MTRTDNVEYHRGVEDRRAGKTLDSNPYTAGGERAARWELGWNHTMPSIDMIPPKQMHSLLQRCREQFAFYADNHHAKAKRFEASVRELTGEAKLEMQQLLTETRLKAQANEAMCRDIDSVIGEPPSKAVRSPDNNEQGS